MNLYKNFLFIALFTLTAAQFAIANIHGWPSIPEHPSHTHIYDEDRVLSPQDIQFVDSLANILQQKTGVEISIALLDDIGDADFRKFATAMAKKWGATDTSESIFIFAALKQKRRFIETSGKTETYLPGPLVERIQQRTLVPAFRQQKYSQGVSDLTWELAQAICKAKNTAIDIQPRIMQQSSNVSAGGILFIAVVFLFLIAAKFGGGRGKGWLWFLAGNIIAKKNSQDNGTKGFCGNFGSKNNFNGGFGGGM